MDPIADLLTRIRNSNSAKHEKVDVPHSKFKENVVKVLKETGYVKAFKVVRDDRQGMMRVYLKYDSKGQSVIKDLKRQSRPGLRRYVHADKVPAVRSGFGLVILSTSKGVMSGDEAKKQNLGGEFICTVW
jgi:small subunit ribosomal protein S8